MNIGSLVRGLLGDSKAGEAKSVELKEGQVVRGVVLSVSDSGKEAVVQIQGTPVRAELETPLAAGQTLNLQVGAQGEGGLPVLKPVSLGEAAMVSPQSMGEAIESLGLANSKAGREIVQAMQAGGLAFTKETAAKLDAVMSAKPPGVPASEWLEAAVISVKRGLPVTAETVKGLQQAVFGPKLHELLAKLETELNVWVKQGVDGDGSGEAAGMGRPVAGGLTGGANASPAGAVPGGAAGANAQTAQTGNAGASQASGANGQAALVPPGDAEPAGSGNAAGVRDGVGNVPGARDGAGNVTGARDGAGSVAGARDGAGSVAGARDGTGSVAGARDGAVNVAGARDGAVNLAGVRDGAGNAAGARDGAGNVAGARDGAGMAAGVRDGAGNAAGARDGAGSVAGARDGAVNVAGAREGAGMAAGVRDGAGSVAGAREGAGDVAGVRDGAGSVAGAREGAGIVAQAQSAAAPALLAKLQGVLSELRGSLPQLAEAPPASGAAGGSAAPAAAQPQGDTAATQGIAPWVGRILKLLGAEHEQQILRGGAGAAQAASGGTEDAAGTLKGVLLQVLGSSEAPPAVKEAAGQLVQQLTGQQLLLNTDRTAPFAQVTMFLPLQGPDGRETASVHIQSRRGRKGELDAANCRLWFDLDMKQLGQTLVDVQVVDRIVSLKLHNNEPWVLELLEGRREEMKAAVEAIGYQLSSLRTEALPERSEAAAAVKPSDYAPHEYKGVDYRI
ncbi:hypothetical protein MHH28_09260 [Paenibacillus sp. FSL K6-1217]|uniref:hypothetical protein n=1 Tax=Paenibacillus sp. FSL K6-1217 TaxID=2921466 RepID=UPI003253AC8E